MIPLIVVALEKRRPASLRAICADLGLPLSFASTLSDMFRPARHNHVSQEAWSRVAVALGLGSLDGYCPDCGRDHAHGRVLRCQGRPVADVVCVAPGYHVAKVRGRPIPRRLSDYPPAALAYLLTHREPMP